MHLIEAVAALAALYFLCLFSSYEMAKHDNATDAEKAARQEDEAW